MITYCRVDRTYFGVSRETQDRFHAFSELLLKWQKAVNLVSASTLTDIHERHIIDSAQLFGFSNHREGVWLDIGSGGGFPGLVCAIVASEKSANLQFVLVESDARKCAFLGEVARQLGLSIDIRNARIERTPHIGASVISARALASLPTLLEYAYPHLAPNGQALFLKGIGYKNELAACIGQWSMNTEVIESVTSPNSAILSITELRHVDSA